jgi:hypothetical protein
MGLSSYARLSKYSLSYCLSWETRKELGQGDGCGVTLPQCGFCPTLFYYIYFTLQCSSSCSILTFESVATGNITELKTKHIKGMQLHFSYVRLSPVLGVSPILRQRMDLAAMLRVSNIPSCNLDPQSRLLLQIFFLLFFFSSASHISRHYLKLDAICSLHILSVHSLLFITPLYAMGLQSDAMIASLNQQ